MDEAKRQLRVFVCHSSGDKPTVRELYRRLASEGWIDVWLDEEKLYPGQDWNYEIEKAVEDADAILVCLTKASVTKEGYVQRELRKILEEAETVPEGTIFIIPVRLDDCEIPRHLRTWQYANYFPPSERDKAYERLLVSLRNRATMLGITAADLKSTSAETSQAETQTKVKPFATSFKAWFEKRRLQNLANQYNKLAHNRAWLLLLPMILLCVSSVLFRWPPFIFQEPTQTESFITTEAPTEANTTKVPITTEPHPTKSPPTEPPPTESPQLSHLQPSCLQPSLLQRSPLQPSHLNLSRQHFPATQECQAVWRVQRRL